MENAQVRDRLNKAIERSGGQRAFAKQHSISVSYVNDVLRGRREPAGKILTALGLNRLVTYREKR